MPRVTPLPRFAGDAYLVGGGASLRGFDFNQLRDRDVIGCNQAFLLGSAVVPVTIFGDYKFWCHYARELRLYNGWVVSPRHTATHQADWIHFFERQPEGLSPDKLAWNGNTGAAAINLALILGAWRVYLLGYDCCVSGTSPAKPESSHWHDERLETPTAEHYARFMAGFDNVARSLPVVFPGREVLNVSSGVSRLAAFPVVDFRSARLQEPRYGLSVTGRCPGRTAVAGVHGDRVGGPGLPLEEPEEAEPVEVHRPRDEPSRGGVDARAGV